MQIYGNKLGLVAFHVNQMPSWAVPQLIKAAIESRSSCCLNLWLGYTIVSVTVLSAVAMFVVRRPALGNIVLCRCQSCPDRREVMAKSG